MSSSNGRNCGCPPYRAGKRTRWQPGDEQVGDLVALTAGTDVQSIPRPPPARAFKRGKESRQAAAATYDANRAKLLLGDLHTLSCFAKRMVA